MIYHETRTYLQFSNYLSILKKDQTNKLYYPDQAHFESQENQFISKKYLAVKTPPKISHQPKIKPNLVLNYYGITCSQRYRFARQYCNAGY